MLNKWVSGDLSFENEIISTVYPLLRKVAHTQLNKARDASLDTTVIVNELYLKLKKLNRIELKNKNHFLAFSAKLIRQIVLEHIRTENSLKKGRQFQQVTLNESSDYFEHDEANPIKNIQMNIDWLTLNQLLEQLEILDPESVKLIELRFFTGLTIPEIAEVLNTSTASVSRNWHFAKNWLLHKLGS